MQELKDLNEPLSRHMESCFKLRGQEPTNAILSEFKEEIIDDKIIKVQKVTCMKLIEAESHKNYF